VIIVVAFVVGETSCESILRVLLQAACHGSHP
jgi:hypothetical protein